MIDGQKEAECLKRIMDLIGIPMCSFPECDHSCGYNPDMDDIILKEVRDESND